MNELLEELSSMSFTIPLYQTIEAYNEYFVIIERMKDNIQQKDKLEVVKEDLKLCTSRGFHSKDIDVIQEKIDSVTQWYEKTNDILRNSLVFKLDMSLQKYQDLVADFSTEEYIEK